MIDVVMYERHPKRGGVASYAGAWKAEHVPALGDTVWLRAPGGGADDRAGRFHVLDRHWCYGLPHESGGIPSRIDRVEVFVERVDL